MVFKFLLKFLVYCTHFIIQIMIVGLIMKKRNKPWTINIFTRQLKYTMNEWMNEEI